MSEHPEAGDSERFLELCQCKRELAEANATLAKVRRVVAIAEKANDAASEMQVATSASFAEAMAYTVHDDEMERARAKLSELCSELGATAAVLATVRAELADCQRREAALTQRMIEQDKFEYGRKLERQRDRLRAVLERCVRAIDGLDFSFARAQDSDTQEQLADAVEAARAELEKKI